MAKHKNNERPNEAEAPKGQENIENKGVAPEAPAKDAESAKTEAKDEKRDKNKERMEALEKELSSAKEELGKTKEALAKEKDDYVRLLAEFDTFRRRSAEEKLKLTETASEDVIKGLLPVLDSCEKALKMMDETGNEADKEGINLIYSSMMSYLKTKGLEVIKAKGEKFNTDFHEAVAQMPVQDESQKGIVYDVAQTGYTLSGKVIRYAKVVVGI